MQCIRWKDDETTNLDSENEIKNDSYLTKRTLIRFNKKKQV